MAFARWMESAVFPTAVGPVSMTSGFFILPSSSDDPLEFFLQLIFAHRNDGRPAVRAVIGIFQCQKFIDAVPRLLLSDIR